MAYKTRKKQLFLDAQHDLALAEKSHHARERGAVNNLKEFDQERFTGLLGLLEPRVAGFALLLFGIFLGNAIFDG